MPLFRRKSADPVTESIEEVEPEPAAPPKPKGYTPKKGEATPRRPVANRRLATPAPANTKEARALSRDKRRQDAADRREGPYLRPLHLSRWQVRLVTRGAERKQPDLRALRRERRF